MEERIMKMLEKMGWRLQPSAMPYILQRLQHEEEEEEEGARVEEKDKKNCEKRVHNKLLDMDMSVVGARFLPDPHSLLQLHSLPTTPCVLQVGSVNDISQSSHSLGHTGRLLRLRLTDGHLWLTAVEYHPIPSLSVDIPPGTKVVLQGAVAVHSGIALLEPNSIRVEGGHVAALHEAWVMQKKYSGSLARASLDGVTGPPPFRALPIGLKGAQVASNPTSHPGAASISTSTSPIVRPIQSSQERVEIAAQSASMTGTVAAKLPNPRIRPGAEPYRPRTGPQAGPEVSAAPSRKSEASHPQSMPIDNNLIDQLQPPTIASASLHEPGASSDAQSATLSAEVPVQNRQAAQKLLERRSDSGFGVERGSARGRGRGSHKGGRHASDDQDERVMTLDEWEALKATSSSPATPILSDQELAWRLQQQFNLEDSQGGQKPKELDAAEQLRLSMFSFASDSASRGESGNRGGGRGRARGRGRGRRHG
ncbi:unnamed protein product [Sphagnum troendelagicum]